MKRKVERLALAAAIMACLGVSATAGAQEEPMELDGEVEEIETEKGNVEITRVDVSKGHLYAKVLEGESATFEKGDVCRP